MSALSIACYALSLLLTSVVAVRLSALARRTGRLPERLLAIASLCLSAAGTVDAVALLPPVHLAAAARWSQALYGAGAAATCAGTFVVFRAGSVAARTLATLLGAAIAAVSLWLLLGPSHLDEHGRLGSGDSAAAYLVSLTLRALVYLWLTVEAGHYFLQQKRGLAFGLNDPLVVLQFLGWSGGSLCMGVGVLGTLWQRLDDGGGMMGNDSGQFFFAGLAALAGMLLWLTFLPPRWYTRAVRERWGDGP